MFVRDRVEAETYLAPTPGGHCYEVVEVAERSGWRPANRSCCAAACFGTAADRCSSTGRTTRSTWRAAPISPRRAGSAAAPPRVPAELVPPQRYHVDAVSARMPTTEEAITTIRTCPGTSIGAPYGNTIGT
ncbi:hypothetical protein Acsp04_56320 [Actinomadura sp. NBRC 104425]|uniref:hypothetical protein n=1 Tax=Actinomadura sp. NBRC 104425 TaxID=3032204 RepID=UPI0024A318AB|nr:hypothetical protein [Actinomadura sp. NBRC 104425]GLZ15397.1 hypothetical protein Acsp04_56320 [Actinomadura sp. NBRC 104425]